VYHLGGQSLDLTVFEYISGMYRALACKHIPNLGGQQFDDALVEHFQKEFHRTFRVELGNGSRGIRKLKGAVENTKKILSTMNQATISVESLHEGMDFQSTITRARFEDLCAAVFTSCIQPIDDVLKTADLDKSLIDNVVLSGGASRMPRIRQLLEQSFPKAGILDRINPDEVIALGAAIQVGILLGAQPNDLSVDSTTQLDCVTRFLVAVIAGTDGMSAVITVIPRLSPLPFSRTLSLDLSAESKGEPTSILLYESDSSKTLVSEHLVGEILLSQELRSGEAVTCLKLLIELTRQQGLSIRVCCQSTEEPVELRIPISE
jgi:L1 cell adhesion molecule like protein